MEFRSVVKRGLPGRVAYFIHSRSFLSISGDEDLLRDFPMPSPARPSSVKKKLGRRSISILSRSFLSKYMCSRDCLLIGHPFQSVIITIVYVVDYFTF